MSRLPRPSKSPSPMLFLTPATADDYFNVGKRTLETQMQNNQESNFFNPEEVKMAIESLKIAAELYNEERKVDDAAYVEQLIKIANEFLIKNTKPPGPRTHNPH